MINLNSNEVYVVTNRYLEDYITGKKYEKDTLLRVPYWNAQQVIAGGHARKADIQTIVNHKKQATPSNSFGIPRKHQIRMALEAISL